MIQMKAILAGNAALAQIEAVKGEWARALGQEGRAIKKEYEKTTKTWEHGVGFTIDTHATGKTAWYTEVQSAGPNQRIYWFVHEGISVMHAKLSTIPLWRPKTQPGVLGSGPGAGYVVSVRKSYKGPKYTPREFTEKIIKVRQKPFEKRMQHATAVGARKATQGG